MSISEVSSYVTWPQWGLISNKSEIIRKEYAFLRGGVDEQTSVWVLIVRTRNNACVCSLYHRWIVVQIPGTENGKQLISLHYMPVQEGPLTRCDQFCQIPRTQDHDHNTDSKYKNVACPQRAPAWSHGFEQRKIKMTDWCGVIIKSRRDTQHNPTMRHGRSNRIICFCLKTITTWLSVNDIKLWKNHARDKLNIYFTNISLTANSSHVVSLQIRAIRAITPTFYNYLAILPRHVVIYVFIQGKPKNK